MEPKIVMRLHKLLALTLLAFALPLVSSAQNISTVVGGGPTNLSKTGASIGSPGGVKIDSAGNVYIIDNNFSRLLRIDHTTKNVSVVAGTGVSGYEGPDIVALQAQMNEPSGLCIDGNDNVFIADSDNNIIREYVVNDPPKTAGHLVDVVGVQTATNPTFGGDGGPVLSANLHFPDGCSFDTRGNLYIADRANNEVRVAILGTPFGSFTAGNIYAFAGAGSGNPPTAGVGADGTVATSAALNGPFDVFVDGSNNVYIATVDNPPPTVQSPMLVRVIPATTGGGRTAGAIYTVAGGGPGTAGASGVAATSVPLNGPQGIFVDANGNVIFTESGGFIVREVAGSAPPAGMTAGNIYTIAGSGAHGYSGDGFPPTDPHVGFASPVGTFVDSAGNLYIADSSANVVRLVAAVTIPGCTSGTICTYAGNGHISYADAPSPTAGELFQPAGIATAGTGELIIADTGSSLLRGVPSGFTSLLTVAGQPEFGGFVGDGGLATASVVNNALAVDLDANNNGYIADTDNCIVRKVDGTGKINTIAGTIPTIPNPVDPEITTPHCGFGGAGGVALSALFGKINGIAVDSHANVFFSDATNNIIWEYVVVVAAGQTVGHVYIVAGTQTATGSFGGDNGPATAAQLHTPTGLYIDSFDNLFIADSGNQVIREVPAVTANGMTKGNIYTVAGTGTVAGFSGDGASAKSAKLNTPFGIFVDSNLNLFIADTNNHVIRKVPSNNAGGKTAGFIYTVAGTPQAPQFDGDGGVATSAHLSHPKGLTQGPTNSLLIADSDNNRIRSVSNSTSSASLTLSTYAINFANQAVHVASAQQPVVITNASGASLTLGTFSTPGALTGTNAADFAVSADCDAKVLASAATCTINVTFTPSAAAAESATLTIKDTLNDTRTVALTGTGVAGVPGAQVSPTTLTFASQIVNTQSAGQDVTVTNNGTAPLTGIAVSFTGVSAGDFSETDTCVGAAVSIAVGANCKITVKFQPTASGARAATLSITATGIATPQTVAITGTAAAGVTLSGATLAFGDQVSAATSAAKSVKLTNGATPLTIASIAVSGPNAADFKETDDCAKAPTMIAPNGTCTINVTFTPGATGARSATVTITDDQGAQTVALTGNGYTLALAAATGGSTSATVTAGQTATYNLQFSVTGASAPVAVSVACTGAPSKATCNAPASVNVTAGTPAAYTVTVSTTAASTAMTAPQSGPNFTPPANLPLGTLTIIALVFCVATLMAAAKNPANRGRAIRLTITACLLITPLAASFALTGCGGGSSGGGGGQTVTGTPAGTYTISVTPTVNSAAQTATKLTLTVQ